MTPRFYFETRVLADDRFVFAVYDRTESRDKVLALVYDRDLAETFVGHLNKGARP